MRTSEPDPEPRSSSLTGWLARRGAIAAAVSGLQALVLYRAFNGGPFSGLIPWDDCLIILRALYNLRIVTSAGSLAELLDSLRLVVIHSPVSDLPAMAGLLFGGGAVWSPYLLNGLVVLMALYAVLIRAGRAPN